MTKTYDRETLDQIDELRAADRRRVSRYAIAAKPDKIAERMLDAATALERGQDPVLVALALRNLSNDIMKGLDR